MEVNRKNIEPTDKVIRRLFEEPSSQEREAETIARRQEIYRENEKRKAEYGFDFLNEKPVQHPDSRFSPWEKVTEANNEHNQSVRTCYKLPR
jgi:hypothetical protein